MVQNLTLRNFSFGGQSLERPLANHISPGTRRALNACVSRNKARYSEFLRATADSEGDKPAPPDKHLINSYRNIAVAEKKAAPPTQEPQDPEFSKCPTSESDATRPKSRSLSLDPTRSQAFSPITGPSCPQLSAHFRVTPKTSPPDCGPHSSRPQTQTADDSSASFFVGAWPSQAIAEMREDSCSPSRCLRTPESPSQRWPSKSSDTTPNNSNSSGSRSRGKGGWDAFYPASKGFPFLKTHNPDASQRHPSQEGETTTHNSNRSGGACMGWDAFSPACRGFSILQSVAPGTSHMSSGKLAMNWQEADATDDE
jgi:hypothetical protein